VRTPLTLLSPAWNSSVSSADGMTVYEIGDAPVLLMSDNGAMIRARLLRDDDHDK
jgi:Putative outer membrane core complex of type IVb secretion